MTPRAVCGSIAAALAVMAAGAASPGCSKDQSPAGTQGGSASGSGGSTAAGSGGTSAGAPSGGGPAGPAAGTGGAAAGAGGSVGTFGCLVTLTPVSAPSFDALAAGPDARFRVQADVAGPGTSMPLWTWIVSFGGGPQTMVPITHIATTSPLQSQIEFSITDPGSYDIQVRVSGGAVCPLAERIAVAHPPDPATFVFRVQPAALSGLVVPTQDLRMPLPGPGPFAMMLNLVPGQPVALAPQDAMGQYLPAYVRVTSVSTGVATEGNTARGPFMTGILPFAAYDVLVVPDGDIAPLLLNTPPGLPSPLAMDPGIEVTGVARDASGAALMGARVVLRDGSRPSTVGISDAAGVFSLRTRAGALSAVVAPPLGAGLPEAHVAVAPLTPIVLDASATAVDLAMTWSPVARGAVAVTVTGSDGTTPVANAEVLIGSQMELPSVGTLVVRIPGQPTLSLPATGAVRASLLTDSSGTARFPNLPLGPYVVTAAAPRSLSGLMPTSTTFVLGAKGMTAAVALAQPVSLTGTLVASAGAAGVRVLARDLSGELGAETVSAVAGASGTFSLALVPRRSYQLVADPPVGSALARTVFPTVTVGAGPASAGSLTVATGVAFAGTARILLGPALAGAAIQVFCTGSPPACVDPGVAIAEAVTAADGTFAVRLPSSTP